MRMHLHARQHPARERLRWEGELVRDVGRQDAPACMHAGVHARTCTCTYVCMGVRVRVCVHVCMRACMHVCMHA